MLFIVIVWEQIINEIDIKIFLIHTQLEIGNQSITQIHNKIQNQICSQINNQI